MALNPGHKNTNVVVGYCASEQDYPGMFGKDWQDSPMIKLPDAETFGQILAALKLSSRSNAKKNGWDFPIEKGFSDYIYGKKPPHLITIWKPEISYNAMTIAFGMVHPDYRWDDDNTQSKKV